MKLQPKQAHLSSFTALLKSEEERDDNSYSLQTNTAHTEKQQENEWNKSSQDTKCCLLYPKTGKANWLTLVTSTLSSLQLDTPLVLLKHPMLLPVPRKHLPSNANVPKNRLAQDNDVFMRLLKSPENAKMSCLKTFCLPPSSSKGISKQQIPALEENNPGTKWTMERQWKTSSHYTELM